MTVCIDCKTDKQMHKFYKRPDTGQRLKRCKECHRAVIRNHRASIPNYQRERLLKQVYGITIKRYQEMFEAQNGACAMCKRRSDRSLCVDHNHVTKQVRSLLCNACNAMLGFAQEDISLLQCAIDYLVGHNTHEIGNIT